MSISNEYSKPLQPPSFTATRSLAVASSTCGRLAMEVSCCDAAGVSVPVAARKWLTRGLCAPGCTLAS